MNTVKFYSKALTSFYDKEIRGKKQEFWLYLILISIISFVLYSRGVDHCIPDSLCDPDAQRRVLETKTYGQEGSYARYNHPNMTGPFLIVHTTRILGLSISWDEIKDYEIIKIGRLLTLFFAVGSGTIFYSLSVLITTSPVRSFFYSFLFLLSPLFYYYAHIYRSDTIVVFFILLFFLLSILYSRHQDKNYLRTFLSIALGICLTLATFTKWPGLLSCAFMIPVLFDMIIKRRVRQFVEFVVWFSLGLVGTVLLIHPGILQEIPSMYAAIQYEGTRSFSTFVPLNILGKIQYYSNSFMVKHGTFGFIVALAGLGTVVHKILHSQKNRNIRNQTLGAYMLLCFFTFFFSFLLYTRVYGFRWLVPLIPIIAFFGIYFFEYLYSALRVKAFYYIIFAVVLAAPFIKIYALTQAFSHTDTRIEHARWLKKETISEKRSLFHGYSGFLPDTHGYLTPRGEHNHNYKALYSLEKFQNTVEQEKIKYIHISSSIYCGVMAKEKKDEVTVGKREILDYVKNNYNLIQTFTSTKADPVYGHSFDCDSSTFYDWTVLYDAFFSPDMVFSYAKGPFIRVYEVQP